MVPMAVVLVFKDTRPPVNSSYMYVAPPHGLPIEPHELVRLRVTNIVTIRVNGTPKVTARATVKVQAEVTGGSMDGTGIA